MNYSTRNINNVNFVKDRGKIRAFSGGMEIPIPNRPVAPGDDCLSDWLGGMNRVTLEVAKLFYYDVWMWETGAEEDFKLYKMIEQECERRDTVSREIELLLFRKLNVKYNRG